MLDIIELKPYCNFASIFSSQNITCTTTAENKKNKKLKKIKLEI